MQNKGGFCARGHLLVGDWYLSDRIGVGFHPQFVGTRPECMGFAPVLLSITPRPWFDHVKINYGFLPQTTFCL